MKSCSACKQEKHLEDFHKCKGEKDGRYCYCKPCANEKARAGHARRGRDPRKVKGWMLKFHYGITLADFEGLLVEQGGKCKICEIELKEGTHTHTDHNHDTGKVRGLLCTNCNRGLGHFQDSSKILIKAAKYLESNRSD